MNNFKNYLLIGLIGSTLVLSSCSDDDAPGEEDVLEVITDVTLNFSDGVNTVSVSASDPDGAGAQPLAVQGPINLSASTAYILTLDIENGLDPNDIEDIGEEILEEDDEHQFFYAFTTDAFTSPAGDGNIDLASDALNYNDMDDGGCAVGLNTTWTTGTAQMGGTFRVVLKHQPDIKTCTTGSTDGDTDFDLTFVLNIN